MLILETCWRESSSSMGGPAEAKSAFNRWLSANRLDWNEWVSLGSDGLEGFVGHVFCPLKTSQFRCVGYALTLKPIVYTKDLMSTQKENLFVLTFEPWRRHTACAASRTR